MENSVLTAILLLVARASGILFIFAAISKLINIRPFINTIALLPYIPLPVRKIIVYLLPATELVIGSLLVVGGFSQYTAIAAICLLISFCVIALVAVNRNMEISCSCFGELSVTPLSTRTIVRNIVIIVLIVPLLIWDVPSFLSLDAFLHSTDEHRSYLWLLFLLLGVTIGLSALIATALSTLGQPIRQSARLAGEEAKNE